MRFPSNPNDAAILSALLFPYLAIAANNLGCGHIRVDNHPWDLSELGGPRSVMHSIDEDGQSWKNTTYTIDICKPLKLLNKKATEKLCPSGSRLCAMERTVPQPADGDNEGVLRGFPIAGELKDHGGGYLDEKWSRLKTSESNHDSQNEGLLLNWHGGFYMADGKKRSQQAIVEFLCDRTRIGTEHLIEPHDKYDGGKMKREDGIDSNKPQGDEDDKNDPKTSSLEFVDYNDKGDDFDILRLRWRTKYACEDAKNEKDAKSSSHWGFFTWFIIVAFLSTATYLIFGSWLNYNRYGARGWDLLPHGDTIRDVPYLAKDWSRRVLNTIQGGGSRGGYAAV